MMSEAYKGLHRLVLMIVAASQLNSDQTKPATSPRHQPRSGYISNRDDNRNNYASEPTITWRQTTQASLAG